MAEWLIPELVPDFIKKIYKKRGDTTIAVFQAELYHHLNIDKETSTEKFLETFHKLKNNNERVNYVYENLKKYNMLDDKFILDAKSDSKATHYKQKGDKCFASCNFAKAFRCYTKMLMQAFSPELIPTAYMNRSAALFKLKLFEECIIDIDRALVKCEDNLKPILNIRRAKAMEKVKKSDTFRAYEEAPKIPTNQKNPVVHCASNCIEIKTSKKLRRHIFATKDIQIGDVVAVETPFTATISEAPFYHCHECFELCYTLIACDGCTQTLYCSEHCKDIAYNKYHKDACSIALSLKELVGKHKAFLLGIKMALLNQDENADEVLKLTENIDDKNICDEKLKTAMTAAFMYDLVKKHTKRFRNNEHVEKAFKDTLPSYLRLCIVQATGIDELCPVETQVGELQETLACAIYPLYGLFRHACCPNVFAHHHGIKRVLRAIRTIKKGEECFVSFGPHYIDDIKEDRQNRLLAQYHFDCRCQACQENWPQVADEPFAVTSPEDALFMCSIKDRNMEMAKRVVPRLIRKMKQLEGLEPSAALTFQQKMLLHCFDVLGNKREIL